VLQPQRQISLTSSGFQNHRSTRERINAIGKRQCLLDQLLYEEHCCSSFAQPPHHHEDAIHQYRRQPGGGLIQH
jgi:hypothetical protein